MWREWNKNGTGMEREWNGNGTGMERGWNGDGTGMEREYKKRRHFFDIWRSHELPPNLCGNVSCAGGITAESLKGWRFTLQFEAVVAVSWVCAPTPQASLMPRLGKCVQLGTDVKVDKSVFYWKPDVANHVVILRKQTYPQLTPNLPKTVPELLESWSQTYPKATPSWHQSMESRDSTGPMESVNATDSMKSMDPWII